MFKEDAVDNRKWRKLIKDVVEELNGGPTPL